jgi:tetratricopeptide (TPR) repeat protein
VFNNGKLIVLLSGIAVLVLTTAIYWSGLTGAFMLDDLQNINAIQGDSSLDALIHNLTHNGSGLFGRSISVLSFQLTEWQFGPEPWGYKFHNLLIHLVNGVLIGRLLYDTLVLVDKKLDNKRVLFIAGGAGALWLLHPLLLSTVLYAVQRMTQLATLFTLLALLTYLRIRQMEQISWGWLWRTWLLLPFWMLLALLSKENGALIVLYILMFEVLAFRSGIEFFRRHRHHFVFVLVFVALPILAGIFLLIAKFSSLTEYSMRNFTMMERLLTEVHVVAFYVQMLFLPRLREMSLYHDDFTITHSLDGSTLLLIAILAALLVVVWRLRSTLPVVAIGIAWFLISHLLESTFLPLELVFEHRNYLAAAGLLLVPIYLVFSLGGLKVGGAVCGLLALMFAFQTYSRAVEWSDESVTLSIAVNEHPNSARARNAMANYLMHNGNLDGALEQLRIAGELEPKDAGVTLHVLGTNCANERIDRVSLARAKEQLSQYPVSVYALNTLDNLIEYISKGKCSGVTLDDYGELIDIALSFEPNLGNREYQAFLLRFKGIHSLMVGRYAEGVIAFRTAHELTGIISYLGDLAKFQVDLGKFEDAADTIDVMEAENTAKLGVESYQLESVRKYFSEHNANDSIQQ